MKEEKEFIEIDFGSMPHKLCEEYLDLYEGIRSETVNTMIFDENFDLSTAYLGRSDKECQTESRGVISNFRTWVYIG